MLELRKSNVFDQWFRHLRDRQAKARIAARLDRLAMGNPGDAKPIGDGISELRIDYGPGYRIYYIQRGQMIIVLLCVGDKSSQNKDIALAKTMAARIKEG